MQVHTPAATGLKCPTCCISFLGTQEHKQHYKSDHHRYNLKRKMVKLTPVTLQQFREKKVDSIIAGAVQYKCNQCGKTFNSAQTLNQHAKSKGHNPDAQLQSPQQTGTRKPNIYQKNKNMCLFCAMNSATLDQNLKHMNTAHSFFVPQLQYCKSVGSLIEYLQEKIEVGLMCITCQNKKAKDFSTGDAVRKHMLDKGHTFMKTEDGYEEYENYYDFSSQFQALLEDQKDRIVPGIQYTKVKVYVEDGKQKEEMGNQEEEDWEDESEESEEGDEDDEWQSESEAQQLGSESKEIPEQSPKKIKTYKIMKPTLTPNDQLLLPNGKTLGHRKYRYLYRQSYRNASWLNARVKSLRYESPTNNCLISRQKLLEMAKHDHLMSGVKNRYERGHLKNGMQNNLLMKYFRCQNSL